MVLKNCPACNKEISKKAKTCPHCGHPLRKSFSWKSLSLIPVVLVIFLAAAHLLAVQKIKSNLKAHFEKTAVLTSAEVQVNPITNAVVINRKNEVVDLPKVTTGILKDLLDVVDSAEKERVQDIVKSTSRSYLDVYGMVIPYKVVVSTK